MKKVVVINILAFFFLLSSNFRMMAFEDNLGRTYNNGYYKSLKDTCVLAGLTFKIIDFKSGRNLRATIKNGEIEIVSEGVQFFKYRVIYYVFSSLDDSRIPVVRIFHGQVEYRVLEILEQAAVGGQYIFEDIVVVDPSGIKLDNEVRSILIERIN